MDFKLDRFLIRLTLTPYEFINEATCIEPPQQAFTLTDMRTTHHQDTPPIHNPDPWSYLHRATTASIHADRYEDHTPSRYAYHSQSWSMDPTHLQAPPTNHTHPQVLPTHTTHSQALPINTLHPQALPTDYAQPKPLPTDHAHPQVLLMVHFHCSAASLHEHTTAFWNIKLRTQFHKYLLQKFTPP